MGSNPAVVFTCYLLLKVMTILKQILWIPIICCMYNKRNIFISGFGRSLYCVYTIYCTITLCSSAVTDGVEKKGWSMGGGGVGGVLIQT